MADLPREFRDGAPAWVLRELAVRMDRLLTAGHAPAAILAAAGEVAAARPIDGDHIAALRHLGAALASNRYDPEVCGRCGSERFSPGGRCPACDADAPMDERERAQLAAAKAFLGA